MRFYYVVLPLITPFDGAGQKEACLWVLFLVALICLLQSSLKLCAGCLMFYVMVLMGIIPQSMCRVCRVTYVTPAEQKKIFVEANPEHV
jgi:hypothetical protein